MPLVIPTKKAAIIKAIKALSFTPEIKIRSKTIPAIRISRDISLSLKIRN
jgi:hypothetical protein